MSLFVKLTVVGLAAGVGGLASLSQIQSTANSLTYRVEMPNLAGLAGLVGFGASAAGAAGTGGPVDRTFPVRRVRIDGLVAQVELIASPQGPVRIQANGKPETLKELQIRAVGDEVVLRLDTEEQEAWFPWNLFNLMSKDRRIQDLQVRISAPLGTPYEIDDMIGSINAGDLDAPLRLDGHSVTARFGRVQSAKVSISGSGRIAIGAIKENLDLDVAGSGRFEAASAAAAQVDIAGGGDVIIGPLTGAFSADVAGSGDVRVARVNGPVDVDIAGSGGVIVDGGRAQSFRVDIAGSGDILFKGEVVDPSIEIFGSGSVKVGCYSGNLRKEVAGSGEFEDLHLCTPSPAPPAQPAPPAPPARP